MENRQDKKRWSETKKNRKRKKNYNGGKEKEGKINAIGRGEWERERTEDARKRERGGVGRNGKIVREII